MKFGGAGGLADIEDVIVWLADSCSSEGAQDRTSHSPPPASPRNNGHLDNENGGEEHRDEANTDTRHAACTTQTKPVMEAEKDVNPRSRPGQRLSIKDQDELMAKIEADPDNMDLLMQLQEVHRSLSMVKPTHLNYI